MPLHQAPVKSKTGKGAAPTNDRNARVLRQRAQESLRHHTLPDGFVIELKGIELGFLNSVIRSVPKPEIPTYEVKTMTGRIELHDLDAKAAREFGDDSPQYKAWIKYENDMLIYNVEVMAVYARACYLDGTIMPEDWSNPNWERRMKMIGVTLPHDIEERWLLYLETTIRKQEEVMALTGKVLRLSDVDPTMIEEAEDSFRDSVQDNARSEDLEDAGADQERVAGRQMAA